MAFPLPFAVLLLIAIAAATLVACLSARLAPARGATAAAADAIEGMATAATARRPWLRRRLDPAEATGLALTAALVVVTVGGLVLGILALLVRRHEALRSIDRWSAAWGHDHATHLSTRLLHLTTDLGDWPVVPVVLIAVAAWELRRSANRYLVPFLLAVVLGDELITTLIKHAIDRARPTLNPAAASLGPSFPSGHSSTSAAVYAAIALVLSRNRSPRVRALLAGGAAGIAVGVASSRVLLDVHWLSDVVAGVSLGWAWFALCAIAFGGRLLRFGEPARSVASRGPRGLARAGSS